MFKMRGKKAGEKWLSIWWFFVLVVILTGIVVGVSIFSASEINVKKLEADILATKVIDCLINDGKINEEFLKGSLDIFKECKIDKEIITKKTATDEGKYYIALEAYKLEDCEVKDDKQECKNSLVNGYNFGIGDFVNQCKIAEVMKEAKNYPFCSEKYVYVLSGEEKLILHVFAGSNQRGGKEVV